VASYVLEHMDFEDGVVMLREMFRVLHPGGTLLVHTAPNAVFMRFVYPILRPLLRRLDRGTVEALEQHLTVNRVVHVHEYQWFSLTRVARRAGLPEPEVWIAEDILRSNQHRHTAALANGVIFRLVGRLQKLAIVRFFLGNDLFLRVRKAGGSPSQA